MAIDTRFGLKCALVNTQSVGNKTCEIRGYINDNKLDILMLAETWLNNYDSAKIREMTPDTHTLLAYTSLGGIEEGEEWGFSSLNLFPK